MQIYLGEIRLVGFTFAPAGWLLCHGQIVNISEHDALYNLIGTTYGGDGIQTFGLPDLRGRAAIHSGRLGGGSTYTIGQRGGDEAVSLSSQHVGLHTHLIGASNTAQNTSKSPENSVFGADSTVDEFETAAPTATTGTMLVPGGTAPVPHDNRMPFLAVNYIISTYGVYPSQG